MPLSPTTAKRLNERSGVYQGLQIDGSGLGGSSEPLVGEKGGGNYSLLGAQILYLYNVIHPHK